LLARCVRAGNVFAFLKGFFHKKKSPSEPIYLAIELKFGVNGAWLKKGTGKKYVPEKFPPTKKEAELLQVFREMSPEDKKIFLALFDKLRKK